MPALAQEAPPADQAAEVEEVVVTGIRAALNDAVEVKREADSIVDVLSAEDVGKFPDKNVAEAIQRLPGVQINREFGEGERVSLRGTAPNLTRTLLNGHGLATADWFILEQLSATRSFNFLMLPSEIIQRVEVYKSPTADLEEGGVGGTIDVRTRNPLDQDPFVFNASAQAAYTERSGKTDPQGSALISYSNAADTFGVLVAGIYQRRQIRRDGVEVLGYFDSDPGAGVTLTPSLIGSALFEQERIRKGGNFAIQFRPSDSFEVNLSGLYSKFEADNYNQNYLAWTSNALGGGGTLTNVTREGDTAIAGTVTSTPGGRGVVFDAIDRIASAQTRNIDLAATYRPDENWKIDARIGYTDADGDTESQPFVEFGAPATFTYDLRGDAPQVSFTNLDPTRPAALDFDFASLHQVTNNDSESYGYLDFERQMNLGPLEAIQFGFKHTDHERETDFLATTYGSFFLPLLASGCNGPCTATAFAGGTTPSDYLENIAAGGTLSSYFQVDRGRLEQILFGLPESVRARVPNYPERFSVEERAAGGYLLGRFKGEGYRGNVGVRIVQTEQTSTGFVSNAPAGAPGRVSNAFGDFAPLSVERSYTDVLPSANFAFDLTDDLVFRMAAARTVARPDFTDVAPRVSLNPGSLTGVGGNPDVDPYRANQFDVSLEYYPRVGTAYSAALYYKDIQSFITDTPSLETFGIETTTPNLSLCTPAGGANATLFNCQFTINRRSNGGGGRIQGIELSAQQPVYGNFGILGNYTYSDAEAASGDPIPGNSEHTVNLTGYYEDERLSARLSYNYRSEFFVTFDRATQLNQASLASLDASINYGLTENISLTFDAINLTNEFIEQYAGEEFRPRAIYDNGRQFYAGVRLRY